MPGVLISSLLTGIGFCCCFRQTSLGFFFVECLRTSSDVCMMTVLIWSRNTSVEETAGKLTSSSFD